MNSWWQNAVIYEVYVRSFADGDGDGDGDLCGLYDRLGYLANLGVDAIWLTPFYPSPMVDGGYDVADYRNVDPRFGTLADFDAMLDRAHELGLRVIIDIVPNHTSASHPWFQEALRNPAARDRYLFRSGTGQDGVAPPNDWESVFGGSAWTRVPDGQWYLHLFDPLQPDLNWRHPDIVVEFESVLRFWLDRGVDGFRVDVAHGMVKADGLPDVGHARQIQLLGKNVLPYFDQDGVHEIYRTWRKILDSYPGERIAVAEAWASTPSRLARYVAADELHQAFNFDFLDAPWDADTLHTVIEDSLDAMALVDAPATWVLSNHDKSRHRTRLGNLRRARAATLLMLALPGAAYIYQGEELGLPEVLTLPDVVRQDPVFRRSRGAEKGRDGCRVPLPWIANAPAHGFSARGRSWLPQPSEWAALAADQQMLNPTSTLSLYTEALRLRRMFGGSLRWDLSETDVLAFRRDGLRCIVNLGSTAIRLFETPTLASEACTGGELPPDAAAWFLR